MRYVIEILLIIGAFLLGLWARQLMMAPLRRDDDKPAPAEPKPNGAGEPQPNGGEEPKKQYGKNRVVIRDKRTKKNFDFFENESAGDDGRKAGNRGKLVAVGGGIEEPSIWIEEPDAFGGVTLDEIECERSYYVTREKLGDLVPNKDCGGPDALAAEYKAVKDEVLRTAIRVAARCRRKPSCLATIEFQASFIACVENKKPEGFFIQTRYQVRVNCFTI